MVLCSCLLDDGSDVTQRHRVIISLLHVVIKADIQWLIHKRLSITGRKTMDKLVVLFVRVEVVV